ncbi:YbgA family protein [Holzapfeliella floricola]|uniref:DUF1722 domain-containing protein n=1 Tax=Holzapfeliella floricola DSM 23037 = JCM 16512 TaxID=1423744 RepID=A0A0R2DT34_9LACO|nr:YbgA family protein [Holzapfeliella floricola]KRN04981.1 hypothetical protein FC86_GL000007 [Holzapfeliella floricola DSM 23037 = JCM 16512]
MENWQKEWAQNKYFLMSRSQKFYNEVRQLTKGNNWTDDKKQRYEEIIEEAKTAPLDCGNMMNAYQHVWGYFKNIATEAEKEQFRQLQADFAIDHDELGPFLAEMTKKYNVNYLLESTLLQSYFK